MLCDTTQPTSTSSFFTYLISILTLFRFATSYAKSRRIYDKSGIMPCSEYSARAMFIETTSPNIISLSATGDCEETLPTSVESTGSEPVISIVNPF